MCARLGICALAAALLTHAAPCDAAETVESFAGPQPIWRLADTDCNARIVNQERLPDEGRNRGGVEWLRLQMGAGSQAHLACPIAPARVIDDLRIRLWLRADQPGVQLMARVVFPEVRDPRDGKPLRSFLHGETYTKPGAWQAISLSQVRKLMEREVRLLRLRPELGGNISDRGAYIDYVAINAYSGSHWINVWTDELIVEGRVSPILDDAPRGVRTVSGVVEDNASPAMATPAVHVTSSNLATPKLRGAVLVADRTPIFLRAIEHNGEPLDLLAGLHLNAVLVKEAPPAALQAEAHRLGLWILCPPPADGRWPPTPEAIDRVAAWWIGDRLAEENYDAIRELAHRIRRMPSLAGKPLVCLPNERIDLFGRIADVVTLEHGACSSRLAPTSFSRWLRAKGGALRSSTPFWVALPSEHPIEVSSQLGMLRGTAGACEVDPFRLRQLAWQAAGSGARGVVFRSHTSLEGMEVTARRRRAALEWINSELRAMEPWAAAGVASPVVTDRLEAQASMLAADRSKLVLMTRSSLPEAERPAAAPVTLTVAGIPVSAMAHHVTPIGLRPPRDWLGAGTRHLVIDGGAEASMVLISEDPLAVNRLNVWAHQNLRRTAALRAELLGRQVEVAAAAGDSVEGGPPALPLLAEARAALARCQQAFDTGDPSGSLIAGEKSLAALRALEAQTWNALGGAKIVHAASPGLAAMETLPCDLALRRRMAAGRWSANLLPAGDFESLERLNRAGWKPELRQWPGIHTTLELSPSGAHSGAYSLRLAADAEKVAASPDGWLVRAVSPPVSLRRGQVAMISCWLRVTTREKAAAPLRLWDSLGGDSLALEVEPTEAWRNVVLYRLASRNGPLSLEIALRQPGEAFVDDVSICILEEAATASTARRESSPAPSSSN